MNKDEVVCNYRVGYYMEEAKKQREIFKRKIRWVFEGFDKGGKVVFPSSFIKLSNRPSFPYSVRGTYDGEGEKIYHPGEIDITRFGEEEETLVINWQEVVSGKLSNYDGVGNLMETWDFKDVKLNEVENDGCIVTWKVSYQQAEWTDENTSNKQS